MKESICVLRKEIESLLDSSFPVNNLTQISADSFLCNFLNYIEGVYVLVSKHKIIYIGLSRSMGLRLSEHLNHFNDSEHRDKITSIGIIRLNYKDWYDIATIEAWLISKFDPTYNNDNKHFDCKPIPSDFDLDEATLQIKALKEA